MKDTIGILCACALGLIAPGLKAETITLNFNSLPSAQGWSYAQPDWAPSLPETNIFRVDGTKLIQDTMGTGLRWTSYMMTNIVGTNQPFTISVRARVTQSETFNGGSANEGLYVGASTSGLAVGFGLSTNRIRHTFASANYQPIDATQFHDYRLEYRPGENVMVFVDNVLWASGVPQPYTAHNCLYLGDGTSFDNARAEITSFVFQQRRGPTVSINVSAVDVCWDSLSNRVYQVQYRSELTTNQWQNLGAALQGNGGTQCLTDDIQGQPHRFYRVVESN